MRLYPIALRIEGRRCLLVGGGRVAYAKAGPLVTAGADLLAVSRDFLPEFDRLEGIERRVRAFRETDLEGAWMAVAATDDAAVNRAVAQACRVRGILCNVVDDPDSSDFHVPSVLDRGPLLVAVSTGGRAPALAKRIRRELELAFPEDYGGYVAFLEAARRLAQARVAGREDRERIAAFLASREGYDRYAGATDPERRAWLEGLMTQGEGDDR